MTHPYRTLQAQADHAIAERLGVSVSEVDALAKQLRDLALAGLEPTVSRVELAQLAGRLFDLHARHQNLAVRARWLLGGGAALLTTLAGLAMTKAPQLGGYATALFLMVLVIASVPLIAWVESYLSALQRLQAALASFERAVQSLRLDDRVAIQASTGVRVPVAVPAAGVESEDPDDPDERVYVRDPNFGRKKEGP